MKSADIKTDVKQEIKELVAASQLFTEALSQNLKCNEKTGLYFSFNLGWYSIQLDIFY